MRRGLSRKIPFSLLGIALAGGMMSAGCTGIHIAPHLGATNTNPAPEYGTVAALAGGGGAYHSARVLGSIGRNAEAKKEGRACSHAVLWLVGWGDSSLNAARKQGQLSKIALVEHDVLAFGGFFYHRFCTIARGE